MDGCTHGGGQVQPDGPRQQCCHHDPDEGIAIAYGTRIDNSLLDGAHDIATGDEGARCLEERGDGDGACQGNGLGTHRRPDVVRHVVGTDVHGHVAANHGSDDEHVAVGHLAHRDAGIKHDSDNEKQGSPQPEQFRTTEPGGVLDLVDVLQFHGFPPATCQNEILPVCSANRSR